MTSLSLRDLVNGMGNLATLPTTVVDLLHLLSDPMASATQVQEILELDPAMTVNVLKISNSAFYGVRREIASVRDALVMLGNRRTATLALATAMVPILRRDLAGYGIPRERFWNHSLLTASASAEAAVHLGCAELQCEAFTAGLIHDVGMLVLDPVVQEIGGERVSGLKPEDEVRMLGFDHCQAGAMLADLWGFPQVLVQPIADHHQPPDQISRQGVTRAVVAGNLLAASVERPSGEDALEPPIKQLDALGLAPDLVKDLRLDLIRNRGEICGAAASLAPARA